MYGIIGFFYKETNFLIDKLIDKFSDPDPKNVFNLAKDSVVVGLVVFQTNIERVNTVTSHKVSICLSV